MKISDGQRGQGEAGGCPCPRAGQICVSHCPLRARDKTYAGAKRETWLGVPMALRFLSYKGLVSSDLLDDKELLNCLKHARQ